MNLKFDNLSSLRQLIDIRWFEFVLLLGVSLILIVNELLSLSFFIAIVFGGDSFSFLREVSWSTSSVLLVLLVRTVIGVLNIWVVNKISFRVGARFIKRFLTDLPGLNTATRSEIETQLPKYLLTYNSRLVNGVIAPSGLLCVEILLVVVLSIAAATEISSFDFLDPFAIFLIGVVVISGFLSLRVLNRYLVLKRSMLESELFGELHEFQQNWFIFHVYAVIDRFIVRLVDSVEKNNSVHALLNALSAFPRYGVEAIFIFLLVVYSSGFSEDGSGSLDWLFVGLVARMIPSIYKIIGYILTIGNNLSDVSRQGMLLLQAEATERVNLPLIDSTVSFISPSGKRVGLKMFRLRKGAWIQLEGRNGVGKSSFFKHLIGEIKLEGFTIIPSNMGRVSVDPDDTVGKQLIGYVPQKNYIVSGTLSWNVTLGRDIKSSDVEFVLALVGLSSVDLRNTALEIDSHIQSSGRNVSGGFIQRIGLARALVLKPDLLLIDEGFSAIDRAAAHHIREKLREALPSTTVIEISHHAVGQRDHSVLMDYVTDDN